MFALVRRVMFYAIPITALTGLGTAQSFEWAEREQTPFDCNEPCEGDGSNCDDRDDIARAVDRDDLYADVIVGGAFGGQSICLGTKHAFVRRLDSDGLPLWRRTEHRSDCDNDLFEGWDNILPPLFDRDHIVESEVFGVAVNQYSGHIYVVGELIVAWVDECDKVPNQILSATGCFVLHLDDNGTLLSAAYLGATPDLPPPAEIHCTQLCTLDNQLEEFGGRAIAIDTLGNVVITGWRRDSSSTDKDIFVMKYTANLSPLWIDEIVEGGDGDDVGLGIATDSNDEIAVVGYFTDEATFDADDKEVVVGSQSSDRNIFIAKYDEDDNFLWVREAGGKDNDEALAVAIDGIDRIQVTGYFTDNDVHFNGESIDQCIPGDTSEDAFVASYFANGGFNWVSVASHTAQERGHGIAVDDLGIIHVTGWYSGTTQNSADIFFFDGDFFDGNCHDAVRALDNEGGPDAFVAKYFPSGRVFCTQRAGGSDGSDHTEGLAIATTGIGDAAIGGRFREEAAFCGAGTIATSTSNQFDAFTAMVTPGSCGESVHDSYLVNLGTLISGGLNELIDSDDQTMRVRSQSGFTIFEPNVLDLHTWFDAPLSCSDTLDVVVEVRTNTPDSDVTIRLWNTSTQQFDTVKTVSIPDTLEHVILADNIAVGDYIDTNGKILVSVKIVVHSTFIAGFDSYFDQIQVVLDD